MTLKPALHYPELQDPQAQPRHTGIATFFRTPHTQDLSEADIGIVGVPFDGGVTHRAGTRHGPRAVRDQSTLLRPYNDATSTAPFQTHRVRDLGDCWIERPYELQTALLEIEAFYDQLVAARVTPLTVGGDHSISWPILHALTKHTGPVGLIHIDAHGDTGGDYMGSAFQHGTPFRRAAEHNAIDPHRTIQIGLRGTAARPGGLWTFSTDSGMRVMPMDEVQDHGWRHAAAEARRIVGDLPCYLSFDIDSLDPVYAPGTGTPEAGGLTMIDALRLLRALHGLNIIGADLVEVSPPFDHGTITSFHGATILFELLCLLTTKPAATEPGVAS